MVREEALQDGDRDRGLASAAVSAARPKASFDRRPARRFAYTYVVTREHPRDPMHGVTLEKILEQLVERHGWPALGAAIPIRCFLHDPSIKSSLTFLRRTPWARAKVEEMYRRMVTSR